MHHYTLNTAHTRVSPRDEVSVAALEYCRGLSADGLHALPAPGYRLYVMRIESTLSATVEHFSRPCVTFGVATRDDEHADRLWEVLEREYHRATELPGFRGCDFAATRRPASAPWVAAMFLLATPAEAEWIADLERCVAWAFVDEVRADSP